MFKRAIIGMGGNKGDREFLLDLAMKECEKLGKLLLASSVYETAAWGGVAKGFFLNQVIVLETKFGPEELLSNTQVIERKLGRDRKVHWGDRTMDIDLLFFENEIIDNPKLTIPHPAIETRGFVLVPLAEILPDFVHPISELTIAQLLNACPDKSLVTKFIKT